MAFPKADRHYFHETPRALGAPARANHGAKRLYWARNRMRSGSTIQRSPAGSRVFRAEIILTTNPRTACLSCLFSRRTIIPECVAGGYAWMLAKSRSNVIKTRPSAQTLRAMAVSSAPDNFSSATVSAPKSALRSRAAHSAGRFSSILKFKRSVPAGVQPCLRAPIQPRRKLQLVYRHR